MSTLPSHSEDLAPFLTPGEFVDCGHPDVIAFARDAAASAPSDREKAIRLFNAVRDGIRYDPYSFEANTEIFKASTTLRRGVGYCIPKAVLLAASARVLGIPARLAFADVRNHLTTPRLRERMGTDIFYYHGFSELYLGERWIRATPTFNLSLCEKFGVKPLDFDGEHDALFHPFDKEGRRHMEYLRYHGSFADLPLPMLVEGFLRNYPNFAERLQETGKQEGDFEKEAATTSDLA
ncbi:MAG: transglutaminase family protein [Nitrospirae bacterium]|nr:transglutaminase family protein [Nitrospirota bacterium]